jgi:anti-sigma B factor antagonist
MSVCDNSLKIAFFWEILPPAMDETVGVNITVEQGVSVVTFEGSSISGAEEIAAASARISAYVASTKPRLLVFDFGGVRFFSSQVLGLLLDIRAKLKSADGRVAISSIDPRLHRVFRITNLDKIFAFYPDKQAAVKALSAAQIST